MKNMKATFLSSQNFVTKVKENVSEKPLWPSATIDPNLH